MKKRQNYLAALLFGAAALIATSCDNTDEIVVDPNAEFDVVLEANTADATGEAETLDVTSTTTEVIAKVAFTSTTSMKRLYITQNVAGAGEVIFKPALNNEGEEIPANTFKPDGSIGLEGSNSDNFEFGFTLPVPAITGNGTIVYKFWVTSGKGDFRDESNSLVGKSGTITLKLGTGANPAAEVKSFANVKLFAPTADGLSKTFVSLLDGKTFDVKSGSEYAAFWDFGYIYRISTAPTGAGFTSTYSYPTIAVDVPTVSGTPLDDLNRTYFVLSTKTAAQFDAIAVSSDLNVVTATTASQQSIGALAEGTVIEFIDAYGKKGMIKVLEVSGTNGSTGFIRFDIKVQP